MSIENAKITDVSLTFADHGCLTFYVSVEGNGWGTEVGGYCIGKGHLNAKEFTSTDKGLVVMMKIMDAIGVNNWGDLTGKYCRVEINGLGKPVYKIGNIIYDKWVDLKEEFK